MKFPKEDTGDIMSERELAESLDKIVHALWLEIGINKRGRSNGD